MDVLKHCMPSIEDEWIWVQPHLVRVPKPEEPVLPACDTVIPIGIETDRKNRASVAFESMEWF